MSILIRYCDIPIDKFSKPLYGHVWNTGSMACSVNEPESNLNIASGSKQMKRLQLLTDSCASAA